MEKEIYLERLKQIEKEAYDSTRKLMLQYALSIAKFEIGDLIKDERWAFVVDKITASTQLGNVPEPVYHGFELKKDLKTTKKKLNRVTIYGNDAILVKKASK